LPVGHILSGADQQTKRVVQAREDRFRGQQLHARRGKFDGQRQPTEALHDPRHRIGILVIDREVRYRGARASGEELGRLTRGDRRGGDNRLRFRYWKRWDRVFLLARHAQRCAARHDDPQLGRCCQEFRNESSRRQNLLEVVQYQQHFAVGDVAAQVLE
jgi:hypothetical protein